MMTICGAPSPAVLRTTTARIAPACTAFNFNTHGYRARLIQVTSSCVGGAALPAGPACQAAIAERRTKAIRVRRSDLLEEAYKASSERATNA